jgi:hypothetical protein
MIKLKTGLLLPKVILIQGLKVKLFYLRWIAIICLRVVPDFKTDGHPLFVL